nr:ribonuclease H-like domain-containing protein [Tanacetum cinerariifolium]
MQNCLWKLYRGESSSKTLDQTLDQTFDRLQKLISQLEIKGEVIKQEDINIKLLRSLPFEWKTHALIWRNKAEIETISLDDLYNKLKIYEPELIGSSSVSQNPQNVAFVSSNSTSSTNKADNIAYGVSIAHTQENLEQIDPDDLEEMDLQWEMAMLTIRARRFIKRTGKNLDINGQKICFDRSKVDCFNYHKNGHFARECRAPKNQENRGREYGRKTMPVENPTENALIAQDGIGGVTHSRRSTRKKVIDSGCSKHMIGNKCYLTDYEDYNGGFVSFGDGKGRISRKGIKREFSVARTPQQNGVAERRNRTLIEAIRTTLVDSKLPTTFWAEAVNTTCYVLNNALVIKPHNKTPYELIHGRPLLIDFMKPFGSPVSIIIPGII